MNDLAAARALLVERGAGRHPHSLGRKLLDHLEGTRAIVAGWGLGPELEAAALFHSVYSTEDFPEQLFGPHERALVGGVIGPQAERLAHAFGAVDRDALYAALLEGEALEAWPIRGADPEPARPEELGALLVLDLANLAEQIAGPAREPVPWMTAASQLASFAARLGVAPPVFEGGRALVAPEDDEGAVVAYLAAEGAGTTVAQLELLEEAARRNPWVGEPELRRAEILLAAGRAAEAEMARAKGRARLALWGVPWDKRRSLAAWLA